MVLITIHYATCIFIFGLVHYGSSSKVKLIAPNYVMENELFEFNCSSLMLPVGLAAEFLRNNETITILRAHNNVCYNTAIGRNCPMHLCRCSADSRSYSLTFRSRKSANSMVFSCKMTFGNHEEFVSNYVQINVLEKPKLLLKDKLSCDESKTVTMLCTFEGGTDSFLFADWTHNRNGIFIRSIKSIIERQLSIILVSPCTYMDEGKYTCHARYEKSGILLQLQKTTELVISASPVLLNKTARQFGSNMEFSVIFYSTVELLSVDWHHNGLLVNNRTGYDVNVKESQVLIDMYGKLMSMEGYKSQLTSELVVHSKEKMSVCVTNVYGVKCEDIQYNPESHEQINTLWVITLVTSVVLVAGFILVLGILYHRWLKHGMSVSQPRQEISQSRGNPGRYHQADSTLVDNHQYESPFHSQQYEIPQDPSEDVNVGRPISETSHDYFEVQPDDETTSKRSENYEEVE